MRRAAYLGFPCLLATLLTGCDATDPPAWRAQPPGDAVAGDLRLEPCTHRAGDTEYPAECGTLVVPENRHAEDSRLIAVPVKRIPAASARPAEPIFHLTGGPGVSNMGYSRVAWFHDDHDIVLVGYRGVDGTVALGCPEVSAVMHSDLPLLSSEGMAAQAAAYRACAERLTREGVDLAGYTLLEVVDDVESARRALGYERINLESGSYGTRLAQIYAWRYQDRVHRSAMVAVNPPGRFWWDGEILQRQLEMYSSLCARDPTCSARTDDLVGAMQTALDRMPTRWLIFPIDRDAVLFATFMGLYSTDGAASTFDVWLAAADGDYSGMALVSAVFRLMIPSGFAWGDSAAKALSADYDFDPEADYVAEVTPGPHLIGSPASTLGWAAARSWPASKIPDEYRRARHSSVQTLMLSGDLDVATPAENARDQLLPLLENGHQVILEGFAHTGDLYATQPGATRHLLTTFFSSGRVDDSRFTPHTIDFRPHWGFPLIAKLAVGGLTLAALLGLLLVRWLGLRVLRRIRGQAAS